MTNKTIKRVSVEISAPGAPETVERRVDVDAEVDKWSADALSAFARKILRLMGADESAEWVWSLVPVGDEYRVVVDVADEPRRMAISDPVEVPASVVSSEAAAWTGDPNYGQGN